VTTQATEPKVTRDHGCQTPDCPNDFSVILVRVDDSSTDLFCEACHLSFALGILQQLAAAGTLPGLELPGAAVAGAS
jgi:hypothetical protein